MLKIMLKGGTGVRLDINGVLGEVLIPAVYAKLFPN